MNKIDIIQFTILAGLIFWCLVYNTIDTSIKLSKIIKLLEKNKRGE